jgi:sugar phosphate isomerase/epimerase
MIRSPIGLRINPDPKRPMKDQIREAASLGAKGVILDATGDLAADRLTETGRRELKHLFRSTEIALIALNLPTRRPFDTLDQLDDRLARSGRAFELAYALGSTLVVARVGAVPPETDAPRREIYRHALTELGRRAEHRGIRVAIETGSETGSALKAELDSLCNPGLAASIDPAGLLRFGHDPVVATRDLGRWVAHAYANDATGAGGRGIVPNPRGVGFPAGALDWEEYLGALEEIEYRGYLTVWPDDVPDPTAYFNGVVQRLSRF